MIGWSSTSARNRLKNDQQARSRPLFTTRLDLVRTTLAHAEALFEIHGDAESVRFLPRERCADLTACRGLLTKMIAVETRGQGYRWSILRQGRVVGSLGFHAWNRQEGRAQLSYELVPRARGEGYASEAVAAVLAFGFDEMGLRRTLAEAHVGNHASVRLLERLGFQSAGGYWRVWRMEEPVWFRRFELSSPI